MSRIRRAARRGMTLVEVMVALTILGIVMLGMGRFTTNFARTVSDAGIRSTASDLVADRLETVKSTGRYDLIESLYQGTESTLPGHPGYTRQTLVAHIGGAPTDSVDYKVVTVSVSAPRMTTPVKKSTVISSF